MVKLGPDHLDTLTSKQYMVFIYMQQGKLDQAEQLNQELVNQREAQLGAHDPATLWSKLGLAWLHNLQGRYDLAEAQYIEIIKAYESNLGDDHPGTLLSKSNLGLVYSARRKHAQSEPLFREVLEKRTALQGPDHPHTVNSRVILGACYREQRKFDLAVPLLEEAVRASKATAGEEDDNTLNAMRHLGLTYLKWGKPELALPLMLATYKKLSPQTDLQTLYLAQAFLATKQPQKALPLFKEFIDWQRKQLGADSPEFAAGLAPICLDLLRHQEYSEAEKHLRECLTIDKKNKPDHWSTFNTQSALGAALLGQHKYAEAEPLLLAGYEGMKQRAAQIPSQVRNLRLRAARERLVQLYDAWDKPDEAAKWRKELGTQSKSAEQSVKPMASG
jgi:Tfp pilus assembly protein PilF